MNDIEGGGGSREDGRGSERDPQRDEEVVARRFDWALREVLGGETAPDVTAAVLARAAAGEEIVVDDAATEAPAMPRRRWLAVAAVFLLGVLTVLGVAMLQRGTRHDDGDTEAQQPTPTKLLEVTKLEAIELLPVDAKAVQLRNLEDDAVVALVRRCPTIEHLSLYASTSGWRKGDLPAQSVTDAALVHVAKLTSLCRLDLQGVVLVEGPGLRNLEALPRLEQLSLDYMDLDDAALAFLGRLPSLRHLQILLNQAMGSGAFEAIGQCVGLRSLVVSGGRGIDDDTLRPLAKLAQLETLELDAINSATRGIGDEDARRRFPRPSDPVVSTGRGIRVDRLHGLQRLHTLSLENARELEPSIGAVLRQQCPRLRDLDIAFCPGVDDTTIEQLVGISTLRRLALANCTGIGDRGIQSLVAAPGLQIVDFGTWSWLDDNSPFVSLTDAEALLRSGKRVDWHPPPDRRREFAELRKRYAGVYGEARTEVVRTLAELEALPASVTRIECRGLGDRAAMVLATRPALVALEFVNDARTDRLTGAGLAAVCQLPRLGSLVLMNLSELHGNDFRRLRDLDAVRSLTFVGCSLGDEALKELPKLEHLVELDVSAIRSFTLAGVESIARCHQLHTLRLAKCTQLDANAIAQLGELRNLTLLDLSGNPGLRDRALMGLRECRAMRRLDLTEGRFTSKGLQALVEMRQLAWLDLSGNDELVPSALLHIPDSVRALRLARCSALDASAAPLLRDRFPTLAELDVGQNDWVTDDVLRTLVEVPSLQVLDLLRCQKLTNASFATLRDAKSLRRVVVTGTACMSAVQHAELATLRPELEVVRQVW